MLHFYHLYKLIFANWLRGNCKNSLTIDMTIVHRKPQNLGRTNMLKQSTHCSHHILCLMLCCINIIYELPP